MESKQITAVLLIGFTLILSGCVDDEREEDLPEGDVSVTVGSMYFQQEDTDLPENELEAEVGDTIVFYNDGGSQHTVTIPEYNVDERINPGEAVIVEAEEPGEDMLVNCAFHGVHEATLSVE